eukprot:jgi/Botrbrau1/15390/Bobra.43_2s0018.1
MKFTGLVIGSSPLWSPLAALAAILLLLATNTNGQTALGDWRTGIATHYGGAQDGMDPYSPSFGTSVGRCNSDPSQRSVTVMITDACPECGEDHMDIQALTFNKVRIVHLLLYWLLKMAPMAIGRIAMRYRQVECAAPGELKIEVDKNYGSGKWLRLMVEEVAGVGSIKQVQIKGQNSDWQGMNNYWGAAWELGTTPHPPLDIRVVDSTGREVTAFGAIKADGQIGTLPLGVQFSFSSVPRADFNADASTSGSASASASAGGASALASSDQSSASAVVGLSCLSGLICTSNLARQSRHLVEFSQIILELLNLLDYIAIYPEVVRLGVFKVSAFAGPEDGSVSNGSSGSSSDSDPIPCITAFQGTTVNPQNCATEGSSSSRPSSSPSSRNSSLSTGSPSTSTGTGSKSSPPPSSSGSNSGSPPPPSSSGSSPSPPPSTSGSSQAPPPSASPPPPPPPQSFGSYVQSTLRGSGGCPIPCFSFFLFIEKHAMPCTSAVRDVCLTHISYMLCPIQVHHGPQEPGEAAPHLRPLRHLLPRPPPRQETATVMTNNPLEDTAVTSRSSLAVALSPGCGCGAKTGQKGTAHGRAATALVEEFCGT